MNYVHPPTVWWKIFDRSIQGITTWNSREKIKSAIPREQNYAAWLVKNGKTVFSKLTQKISLPVSGEPGEEVKIAINLQFSFPRILDCYFSEISCNYHFRQIFNGFWTSNFDFYRSLALKFSCVMVRLSESRFQ